MKHFTLTYDARDESIEIKFPITPQGFTRHYITIEEAVARLEGYMNYEHDLE